MGVTIYLNIGSNQGDRHAHIERAVALIAELYPHGKMRRSTYYESAPWGYTSTNRYINQGIAIETDAAVDPISLLRALQRIEHAISPGAHRNADGTYRDRDIDIDIIAIDQMVIDAPELQLPHPRAGQREFVMTPLQEVAAPEIVEFVLNHTMKS